MTSAPKLDARVVLLDCGRRVVVPAGNLMPIMSGVCQ